MFKSGSVTIVADDLKKAEQFYVEALGLKVQFRVEGHLVQVEAPGLTIGLLHPREGQDSHPGKIRKRSYWIGSTRIRVSNQSAKITWC